MTPADLREQLTPLVDNYPHPQAALVPVLHFLRDRGAACGEDTLEVVADVCQVERRQVAEMLGHYSVFAQPPATQTSLCLGLICYLRGAKDVLDRLQAEPVCDAPLEHVKVSPCLGYCHAAPVMALGDGSICKIIDSI